MKLRNTYQVPAGQTVTVDTPSGQKTYRGGQFVPPEELAHAQVKNGGGGSNGGGSPNGESAQPQWEEIVKMFKSVDLSNPKALNQASYNIQQFLPIKVSTSSNRVTPLFKFAAELSLANFLNSIPGCIPLLQESKLTVNLISPQDTQPTNDEIAGKEFNKVGHLDLQKNEISLWQDRVKIPDTFIEVANFLSHKVGILLLHTLTEKLENSEETLKLLSQNEEKLNNTLQSLMKQFGDNVKKAQSNEDIIQLQKELQLNTIEKEGLSQLINIVEGLKNALSKEGSDDEHIDELLKTNQLEGLILQVGNILEKANTYSLSINKTFNNALELLSTSYPETLTSIRGIIEYLNDFAQQKESIENPQE